MWFLIGAYKIKGNWHISAIGPRSIVSRAHLVAHLANLSIVSFPRMPL
jgi:hypothetical protein